MFSSRCLAKRFSRVVALAAHANRSSTPSRPNLGFGLAHTHRRLLVQHKVGNNPRRRHAPTTGFFLLESSEHAVEIHGEILDIAIRSDPFIGHANPVDRSFHFIRMSSEVHQGQIAVFDHLRELNDAHGHVAFLRVSRHAHVKTDPFQCIGQVHTYDMLETGLGFFAERFAQRQSQVELYTLTLLPSHCSPTPSQNLRSRVWVWVNSASV
jgi:hypothetical protein